MRDRSSGALPFHAPGVSIEPHPSGSPDVQAMIAKVHFGAHPEAEAAGLDLQRTQSVLDMAWNIEALPGVNALRQLLR